MNEPYTGPERRDLTPRGKWIREMCEEFLLPEGATRPLADLLPSCLARTYDEGRRAGQAQAVAELGAVVEAAVRRAMGKE